MKAVFVLYDRVAELYMLPMFFPNLGVCMRAIKDEASRGGEASTGLAQHPGDFDLCEIGSYDEETGELVKRHEYPRVVCRVSDLLGPKLDSVTDREAQS